MSDELFRRILARLDKIACPVCLNTRFSVVLRCDFSARDRCMLVGECHHCSYKFDIENVETMNEIHAQAERMFSHHPCPCGGSTELRFLCDLKTQDCFFAAVCCVCGGRRQVFPVQAGSESGLSEAEPETYEMVEGNNERKPGAPRCQPPPGRSNGAIPPSGTRRGAP